jgi:acyl-homoserine lactone acylase PvdQ
MRRVLLVASLTLQTACNPLACFAPGDLPKDAPLLLTSTDGEFPKAKVEVRVDENGVPHIKGKDELDTVYGMGFMQGRDRTFQLLVFKHAMSGRLTELFGEGLLESDKVLRLYSYRSDEAYERLDERDQKILQAFAAGVNAGAKNAGGTSEMVVLGASGRSGRRATR